MFKFSGSFSAILALVLISGQIISANPPPKYVVPPHVKVTPLVKIADVVKDQVPLVSGLEIDLPETAELYTCAELRVRTNSSYVQVKSQQDLFNRVKVYEAVNNKQGERLYIFTGQPGRYLVTVTTFSPETGLQEEVKVITIGGTIPPPGPPPPGPTPPGPTPPVPTPPTPPTPVAQPIGLMIIYESDDLGKAYMKSHLPTLWSTKLRSHLTSKGYPFRIIDDDPPFTGAETVWAPVREAAKAKEFPDKTRDFEPVVVITDKSTYKPLYIGKLPGEEETMNLLKKWGGE